ncbi:hypothetical protein VTH06DRAFT_2866 [Thermothelomyces fergusii]
MALCSALPWRACSPQRRIQQRFALAVPEKPPFVGHAALVVRTQSTASDRTRPARRLHPSSEPSAETAPARSPPSLVDRFSRVPVRPDDPYHPVIVKPVTWYPHKCETREALLEHHRAYTQQLRLRQLRPAGLVGDWRAVLSKLIKWTPPHERQGRIKVVIPKHSLALLLSDHERNLWNIRSRTDCDMMLYRPADKAAPFDPYIVLSGQPTAMTAAVDDILKVSKGVTVVNLDEPVHAGVESSQAGQPPAEGLNDSAFTATRVRPHQMSIPCRPYRLNVRADQIPRPARWTAQAFQQYIAALIMGDVDVNRARELYRDGVTHIRTVVRQLHAVFHDPAASAAVSLPTLRLALRYLTAAGSTYVKEAQALFSRAEELGLRLSTDIYNVMAEMSVRSKNLPAFDVAVSQMVRHGYKPNLGTWLLFLRLIESEEVRRYILQAMDTKNFFINPAAVEGVSSIMADHDAYRAIQQGQSFDAFVAGLRELYGPEWQLGLRAANRYLDVFGKHSKFGELRQLLVYMSSSEHSKPDTVSLNTVLTHCKHQRKVDLAVDLVRMLDERGHHVADRTTFRLLYELARRTRKPNLLGAVWRYAHRVDMTNYRMQAHGIKVLAGERESAHLTGRIQGLWEEPRRSAITRQEFMESLLLCDYNDSLRELSEQPRATRGQVEEHRYMPSGLSSQALSSDDTVPHENVSSADRPENEPQDTLQTPIGRQPAPIQGSCQDTENPSRTAIGADAPAESVTETPPNARSDNGAGGGNRPQQILPLTAAEKYELYSRAMSKTALDFVPSVRLGDFLREALDRDRYLHTLAHSDEARNTTLQVDLDPVKLPLEKRKRPMYDEMGMLRWLDEKRKKQEEAGEHEEEKMAATAPYNDYEPEDRDIDVNWAYQKSSGLDGPQ